MTLNLIETLKTSIYNPKHTNNTKIPFNCFKLNERFQESLFFKKVSSNKPVCYTDCVWHYFYFMLRAIQPN